MAPIQSSQSGSKVVRAWRSGLLQVRSPLPRMMLGRRRRTTAQHSGMQVLCRPRAIPCLCSLHPAIQTALCCEYTGRDNLRSLVLLYECRTVYTRSTTLAHWEPGVRSRSVGLWHVRNGREILLFLARVAEASFNLEPKGGSSLVSRVGLQSIFAVSTPCACSSLRRRARAVTSQQETHQRACATGDITSRQSVRRTVHFRLESLHQRPPKIQLFLHARFAETSEALLAGTLARDPRLIPLVPSTNSCLAGQSRCSGELTSLRRALSGLGLQTAPRGEDYYVFALALAHETWLPQASRLSSCRGGPFI